MLKCCRTGCEERATKWPTISFASVVKPDGPRGVIEMRQLTVCDTHASPDPAQYVGDEGWAQIVRAVKGAGKAFPDRKSLVVEFRPVLPLPFLHRR